MECLGGNQVGVKKGHWRMNSSANVFVKCLDEDACLGSKVRDLNFLNEADFKEIEPVGECKDEYNGNLCNNCKSGYGKTNDGASCYDC